jgi:hypothetical protein
MAASRFLKTRSTRQLFVGGLAVLSTLVFAIAASAGPVGTAGGFEDDDANLVDNAAAGIDWNTFSRVSWLPANSATPTRQASKVSNGFTFKGIEDWQATTADSGFAGGTKQDDNCPTVISAKAPNKDDLKRIYLASTVGSNGHIYLNLAWVRIPQNTTSPSAHVGFEFNKGSTACAGSGGLVNRTAGDILIVYDFEGGGTPVLTLRRWVTSGPCEVSSNSAPCWGVATNLTAGGFAEGAVNTGGSVLDQLAPPALGSSTSVDQTLGTSEFGEAGIDLTGAGVFTANSCESFGKAFGVSRSSGSSGTAQMKDLVGPGNFQLSNCGTVIIRKQTDPDGDTVTNFGYTTNVTTNPATTTSPFSLKDDGVNTIINVVAGSGKTVSEDDPSLLGYDLQSIDCSASSVPAGNISTSTVTRTVTFSIAGGQTLDCTFTNNKREGALRILKNSTKGGAVANAGAVFSYDSSSVTDNGTGDEDPDVGEVCVSGLAPGDYTVSETSPPPGYAGDGGGSQTATVVAGTNCSDNQPTGAAEVTFTNAPLADIQVRFRDGGSGETQLVTPISCDNTTGDSDTSDTANWDDTLTISGVEAPTTITCTIDIDP